MEKTIKKMAKLGKGLTFGYIGNFESWGDDRQLRIWDDKKECIWKAPAKGLSNADYRRAVDAIVLYKSKLVECIITKTRICPEQTISGNICSKCELPDL